MLANKALTDIAVPSRCLSCITGPVLPGPPEMLGTNQRTMNTCSWWNARNFNGSFQRKNRKPLDLVMGFMTTNDKVELS